MIRLLGRICHTAGTWAILGLLVFACSAPAMEQRYLGPSVLVASKDAETLFVLNSDARQVVCVELPHGKVARRIQVPAEPTGAVLTPDGSKLIVTCAAAQSTIVLIDVVSGEMTTAIPAGHTAMGPAITPDGKRLYVCNRFNNDVSIFDLATGKEVARVPAVREPVVATVTPDGKTVLVANFLPNERTDEVYGVQVAAAITLIDAASNETTTIELHNGSHSLRDMCVSPDGRYAYVTHILSNFELIASQLDQGWMNINAVSVIDVREQKLLKTIGLDEMFSGAGNPWGVSFTDDGKWICVSHAGTHELTVIATSAAMDTLLYLYASPLVGAIYEDPRKEPNPLRRIQLPGKGPRGLVVVGAKIYIAEYFSDTLAVVDLEADEDSPVRSIALGPKPVLTQQRQGEILFNDASICYQHWQSCASCHPDARSDAVNWDLLNDGAGTFKNTKSLLLAHKTPPVMAEGVRESAEVAVRAGIDYILFATRPESEAQAIDTYLKSLKPTPSPHLVEGRLSAAAERGKKLFQSNRAGCYRCHPAPLYTDLKMHDMGTRGEYEYQDRYDTPSLVEVWRTAPYLHSGRYVTIKELIVDGKHGLTQTKLETLSRQDINDLVAFVLSL